jgi:ribosome-binding protein aMBF1 (putative translation factor)
MNQIRPLVETPESVTLSRADFETLQDELEDAADRINVLQDILNDTKPGTERYLLTMDETMRIIDGESPITVWREKRGMSVRQLADLVGLHDIDILDAEKGGAISKGLLYKLSDRLGVTTEMLIPPNVAP